MSKELTYDEYDNIKCGKEYEEVTKEEIVAEHRWFNVKRQVFQNQETLAFVRLEWTEGNNETSEVDYKDYPATVEEVEPYEETVTFYREKA